MNTKFLLLAAASFMSAALDCPPNELDKYAPLKLSPNLNACQDNSGGFDFFKSTGWPTDDQLVQMCPLPTCCNRVKELLGYNIADCLIVGKLNVMFLALSFEPACSHLPPASTTAIPTPTTVAPTPTSPAPSPETPPSPAPTPVTTTATRTLHLPQAPQALRQLLNRLSANRHARKNKQTITRSISYFRNPQLEAI